MIKLLVPPTFKLPLIFRVFKLDIPDTFNDDNNVESPDINKLLKLVLLNIDVDVNCKFDVNDKNDLDFDCKLFNDNDVDVEKLEKVVLLMYTDGSIDNLCGASAYSMAFTNGNSNVKFAGSPGSPCSPCGPCGPGIN